MGISSYTKTFPIKSILLPKTLNGEISKLTNKTNNNNGYIRYNKDYKYTSNHNYLMFWKISSNKNTRDDILQKILFFGLPLLFINPESYENKSTSCETTQQGNNFEAGQFKEGLPVYTRETVSKHGLGAENVWVTYKYGVYDITQFINIHPGGSSRISLAAGGAIDPFWAIYGQHNTEQIAHILEELRIGNLDTTEDLSDLTHKSLNDPFENDPKRHPGLITVSAKPFNAETPVAILTDSFITPNSLFFVRNHLPVPHIDPKEYKVQISCPKSNYQTNVCFDEIKTKFNKKCVTATIQCAGNRRNAFIKYKPVRGLSWNIGAIGNAKWGGVSLRQVLESCGYTIEKIKELGIKHIQFEGWDQDAENQHYGASIPVTYVYSRDGDVILAYEMNDEELPLDHGFPLRVIVPGVVGARNVKWLKNIILSDQESQSFWQQNDYRSFSPSIDWSNVDWRKAPSIQEYPVQSGICTPLAGTIIDPDTVEIPVKGYAWSGGGRAIIRVEVSIDNGKTWYEAQILQSKTDEYGHIEETFEEITDWSERPTEKAWTWVIWSAYVPVNPELYGKELEICCRAVDSSYNTQPESPEPIWNLRGCLCNSWDRVVINITPSTHT